MTSRDKKPSKPSTSRTGGIRTLSDLNRPSAHDSDSDSDGPQEYYTGGEKSGMLVQDPSKGNDVDAIFDQARQLGATQGPLENLQPSSSRSFTGTGRLLSGETVPTAPQQPESVVHNIVFWRNGFSVNDGPLRSLDDPENASFLESIRKSECPKELEPADRRSSVHVNLIRRDEKYPEPEVQRVPFRGVGRTLGSSSATESSVETNVGAPLLSAPAPSEDPTHTNQILPRQHSSPTIVSLCLFSSNRDIPPDETSAAASRYTSMAETDCEKRLVNWNDKKKRSADLCVHMGRASMAETDREKRLVNRNNKKMRLEELKIGKTEEELDYEREFSELVHKETLKLYKEMKKERAERLQEYMKEPWPPVWKPIHESIHYKCGLISSFVNDSWDILCMNEIDFKSHPVFAKWANDEDCLKKMQAFFKLVLNSRGYDVDCRPPKPLYSPYYPIRVDKVSTSSKYYTEILYPLMKCVAQRINIRAKDFGESFKPPYKIKKYVEALTHLKCLITFSGELFSRGRFVGVMDVQAMLHMEGGTEYECVEWRYKREDKNWPRDRTLLFSKMRRPRSTYSHSNAVVAAPAADSELPKTNTNTEAKTKTETVEKKGAVKTIIIEHGEYYMSFRIWADRVKEAVKRDFPGVSVVINPKGPRRNSFEIREEGGEVFVSMLDMSRPFMAFRALDKEKLIADILEKIR